MQRCVPLRAQELSVRAGRLPPVEQAWQQPVPDRGVTAAADRRVGRHPIQPRPDLVRHAAGAGLPDEPDERVLEKLLGGLAIAGHPDEKPEQLAPMGLVQRRQLGVVDPTPGAQPLDDGLCLIGCGVVGQVGHSRVTSADRVCYRAVYSPDPLSLRAAAAPQGSRRGVSRPAAAPSGRQGPRGRRRPRGRPGRYRPGMGRAGDRGSSSIRSRRSAATSSGRSATESSHNSSYRNHANSS